LNMILQQRNGILRGGESIPEFTPATLAIVLITVSILAVVLSKKFKKRIKS